MIDSDDIKLLTDGYFCGKPITLACDLRCEKAWGINNRPCLVLSQNEDDYAYFADNELDIAPINPGTYEGDDGKPGYIVEQHNKWCCRECERCKMTDKGKPIVPRDMSKRDCNMNSSALAGRIDFTGYWTKSDDEGVIYISTFSLDEALEIARWHVDLYMSSDGAEIRVIEGIVMPVHGDVTDYDAPAVTP